MKKFLFKTDWDDSVYSKNQKYKDNCQIYADDWLKTYRSH